MDLRAATLVLLQALLTACAILMSLWANMPWVTVAALAVLGATAITAQSAAPGLEKIRKLATAAAWLCTLFVPASLLLIRDETFTFDTYLDKYYATLAWLIAASILPASSRLVGHASINRWKVPVMAWAFGGALIWVVTAYVRNQAGAFYVGLLITAALLVFCHVWWRLSTLAFQAVNTLLVFVVGLPLADVVLHPSYRLGTEPDLRKKLYSYDAATRDPSDFAHWWNYYLLQWAATEKDILLPPDDGYLPYRLRPGSEGRFMQRRIVINELGFRGREITQPKGDQYRIVALGASTTFGVTFEPDDRPWPELLEQCIRERLNPGQPVEVINAGVPGYRLGHNLHRFSRDILPLKPDMVICYHGINGFDSLDERLPSTVGKPPPAYRHRPLHLLADCEYRLRLMRYQRQHVTQERSRSARKIDPLANGYAEEYRQLIGLAQTHGFRLVLATFSMAANKDSDADLVRFYEVGYRQAPRLIKSNDLHSTIVRRLCEQHPEVCLVDTRPVLDGHYTNFVDLVHFSPEGNARMAETIFSGIQELLKQEIPAERSRPTGTATSVEGS